MTKIAGRKTAGRIWCSPLRASEPAGIATSVKRVAIIWAALLGLALSYSASAAQPPALNRVQLIQLLVGGVANERVAMLVRGHGIDFKPRASYLNELRRAGADEMLIRELQRTKPRIAVAISRWRRRSEAAVEAHLFRAAADMRANRDPAAVAEYRAAIADAPEDSGLHFDLGYLLGQGGRWQGAAAEYRAALDGDPHNPLTLSNLGAMLRESGDIDGALAEYRRALTIDPTLATTHYNYGLALRAHGDLAGAVEQFKAALALHPEDERADNDLGVVLQERGELEGALAAYREAERLAPQSAQAHFNLAGVLLDKSDTHGAEAEYREAVRLAPRDAQSRLGLSLALEREAHRAEADEQCRRAVGLAPGDAEIAAACARQRDEPYAALPPTRVIQAEP